MNLCFKIKLLPAVILFALALTLFAPVGLGAGPISLSKKSIPAITLKISPRLTRITAISNIADSFLLNTGPLLSAWVQPYLPWRPTVC